MVTEAAFGTLSSASKHKVLLKNKINLLTAYQQRAEVKCSKILC